MCKWNISMRDAGHFFIDWFNVLWGKDTWLKEDLKKKKFPYSAFYNVIWQVNVTVIEELYRFKWS